MFDPESGQYTEITSGLKEHPLDAVLEDKMGQQSTAEIVVASNEVIELWKKEIARIFKRLKSDHPDKATVFEQAEKQWQEFFLSQRAAIWAANDQQGTLYSILAAQQHVALVRDYGLNLAKWGKQ